MTPEQERAHAEAIRPKGVASFDASPEEMRLPVVQRLLAALREEQALMREHLESPQNIESTTLLRGRLQLVKEILARADEVGPESRQSEPQGPESAFPARVATGFPQGF